MGQMDFMYANELKQLFSVCGHFYDLDIGGVIHKCRSVLEISLISESLEQFAKPAPLS